MTKVMTISSIRGGVGKSSLALELALHLALKGRVLLIDADFYSPTQFHEIKARSQEDFKAPKAFFRDVLRGIAPAEVACTNIFPSFDLLFSDPKVNLWELSKDIGIKNFWIEDNPEDKAPIEMGLTKLKEFTKKKQYEFVIIDTMGGLDYPVIYFNYISNIPILLARPSIPQIGNVIGFVNLIGKEDARVNLIWSNVPSTNNNMKPTRELLEKQLEEKCHDKYKILGYLPNDPEYEQKSLLGSHDLIPGKISSPYYQELANIAKELVFG